MRLGKLGVVLVFLAALVPGAASAQGGGGISGTVTDSAGLPLGGICVTAGTGYSYDFGSATTGADGTYAIEGLSGGTFRVLFEDCNEDVRYLRQWYAGRPSFWEADPVDVVEGETTSGIDVSLIPGGFVSGELVDEDSDPASACVAAVGGDYFGVTAATWSGEDGRYRIGPLPPGEAHIAFADCTLYPEYESFPLFDGGSTALVPRRIGGTGVPPQGYVPEWFDDARWLGESDALSILPGVEIPGVDAELAFAGGITGVVTDEAGNPLADMCVETFDGAVWRWAYTQDNGFYAIDGINPGTNKVAFFDCVSGDYRYEWFENAPSEIVADPVTVTKLTWTNHIDAALAKRPKPDLAITDLRVTSVPIQAVDTTIAPSPWLRKISVDLANLGTAPASDYSQLDVWVVSRSDGAVDWIASEDADLAAGERLRKTFEWNGSRTFGDVRVVARLCSFDDANRHNDTATADGYSLVGGTGIGFRTTGSPYGYVRFCHAYPIAILGHRTS